MQRGVTWSKFAYERMKLNVEVQVAKEYEEVEFDICSAFLFTLWRTHPELDFSCFGKEVVEAMKQYVIYVANKEVVETLLAPDQTGVDLPVKDASNPAL